MAKLFNEAYLTEIGKLLLSQGNTIAVAESVTSGLLQFALGSIENASRFYQGGITAYNIGQKYKHLYVEPIHALDVNGVSEQVAMEMATQVCSLFNSKYGIGVTGYATPVLESNNHLFAYCSIVCNGHVAENFKLPASEDDPFKLQLFYVNQILQKLADVLKKN